MKRIKDINWVNFGFTFYPPPKKQGWEFAVWFIEQISKSESLLEKSEFIPWLFCKE